MTKSQIFFWLLVSFIAGVAVASYLPFTVPVIGAVFGLGGAIAAFGLLKLPERGCIAVGGFVAIAAAFGVFWFLRADRELPSALRESVGQRIQVEGTVVGEPERSARSQRVLVAVGIAEEKILLTARPFPAYRYGDRIRAAGRLERPENFSEDFDYAAFLAKDDIFSTMSFPEVEIVARDQGRTLHRILFHIKSAFADALERHLPEPHAAFMAGLLLGERQSFPTELSARLRVTGTSHLVALSGYNITIVGDALLKTLMFVFIPLTWAFWLAAAGIVGFTLLTGAAASVVRAALMGILVLVARRAGRRYHIQNALCLAAAAMLLHNPKILRFDVGFQLSFLATLGLVYGAPVVERWYERAKLRFIPPARDAGLIRDVRDAPRHEHRRFFLRDVLIATLSAQLAVLPLLVLRFGQLSLVSPFANLAILPLIPATMFFGFATGGISFLSDSLGRLAAGASWFLLEYELAAIGFFARLPGAAWETGGVGAATVLAIYLSVGYRRWRSRRHEAR